MTIKKKRFSFVTTALFVLAIGLLLFSAVGSARAALNIQSNTISSEIQFRQIGIAVGEEDGVLFTGSTDKLIPGKKYDNVVSITNDGTIDEYVRVTVYKFWKGAEEGEKDQTLDADLILFKAQGWAIDNSLSTKERTVFYSTSPIKAGASVNLPFSVVLDSKVQTVATNDGGTITYKYKDKSFGIQIVADGVQTHNASDAMKSAWGKAYIG